VDSRNERRLYSLARYRLNPEQGSERKCRRRLRRAVKLRAPQRATAQQVAIDGAWRQRIHRQHFPPKNTLTCVLDRATGRVEHHLEVMIALRQQLRHAIDITVAGADPESFREREDLRDPER
jgi:hypothetical protein